MMFRVFSVFDDKAKAFLPPFFLPEVGEAVRAFRSAINDSAGHEFSKYPADYTLFLIGQFDGNSGRLIPSEAIEALVNGLLLRRSDGDQQMPAQLDLVSVDKK